LRLKKQAIAGAGPCAALVRREQSTKGCALPHMLVPEETVLSFVRSSIRSAWVLEVLLLVRRASKAPWTIASLVQEVRGSLPLVTETLQSLKDIGLIEMIDDDVCIYKPRSRELDEVVEALVELYAQKPITVLRTIFTSPNDKIRSFSDAFLLRKAVKP
jgi:hypothetical protein